MAEHFAKVNEQEIRELLATQHQKYTMHVYLYIDKETYFINYTIRSHRLWTHIQLELMA